MAQDGSKDLRCPDIGELIRYYCRCRLCGVPMGHGNTAAGPFNTPVTGGFVATVTERQVLASDALLTVISSFEKLWGSSLFRTTRFERSHLELLSLPLFDTEMWTASRHITSTTGIAKPVSPCPIQHEKVGAIASRQISHPRAYLGGVQACFHCALTFCLSKPSALGILPRQHMEMYCLFSSFKES